MWTNVVRLVRKDLAQQRLFFVLALAFEVVSSEILFAQMHDAAAAIGLVVLQLLGWVGGFVLCFRTIVLEEKNRSFLFLRAMPISAFEIVVSKVATNVLLVGLNFGALLLWLDGAKALGQVASTRPMPADLLFVLGASQVFSNVFFLSIALVFDSEKAVWVPFPCIWIAAVLGANARSIAVTLGLSRALSYLVTHLWAIGAALSVGAVALVASAVPAFARRRVFG